MSAKASRWAQCPTAVAVINGFIRWPDACSVAGEVGVALGKPASELDDRITQFSVALAADALAGPGPTGGLL
jgi:hypothetical protein